MPSLKNRRMLDQQRTRVAPGLSTMTTMLCVTSKRNTHYQTGGYIALGFDSASKSQEGRIKASYAAIRPLGVDAGSVLVCISVCMSMMYNNIVNLAHYSR